MAKDALSLLSQANCYACFGGGGTTRLLELMLVQHWATLSAVVTPVINAWVARAKANGGNPSPNSIAAVTAFWTAMVSAGLDSKMIHVNPIAPDDYPTATTPLIVGPGGFNQWHDPSGLLQGQQHTLNLGLKGDVNRTAQAIFDTGVIPSNTSLGTLNAGISIYISVQEPDGTNHTHGGCDIGSAISVFKFIYDFEFVAYNSTVSPNGFAFNTNGGANTPFAGFASVNVEPTVPSWNIAVYGKVNGASTWRTLTNLPVQGGGGFTPAGTVPNINSFGWFDCHGAQTEPSAETLSFASFHQGLTPAQITPFFNAVQALRVAFGGGFV